MSLSWDPDWVVAPGETLREWFDAMGLPLSVAELYGIDERTLKRLFWIIRLWPFRSRLVRVTVSK